MASGAGLDKRHDVADPPRPKRIISGSANWANKADVGLVIHRDPNKDPTRTDIFVRKVRFKSVGKIGMTSLRYERATGRYSEIPLAAAAGNARGYAND
jgi:twinkle protein